MDMLPLFTNLPLHIMLKHIHLSDIYYYLLKYKDATSFMGYMYISYFKGVVASYQADIWDYLVLSRHGLGCK